MGVDKKIVMCYSVGEVKKMNKNAVVVVIVAMAIAAIVAGGFTDPLGLRDGTEKTAEIETIATAELQKDIDAVSARIDGLEKQVEKAKIPDKRSESVYTDTKYFGHDTALTIEWTRKKIGIVHSVGNDRTVSEYWPKISDKDDSLVEYLPTQTLIVINWQSQAAEFYKLDSEDRMSAQIKEIRDNGNIPKTTIQ